MERKWTGPLLFALVLATGNLDAQGTMGGGGGKVGNENGGGVPSPETGVYDVLDNVEGSFVQFGYPPVRPVATDATGIYALNNHDSTVQRYTNLSGQPSATYRVPWGPVSLATWHDPDAGGALRLLVVSRGTEALTILDPVAGRIVAVLPVVRANGERLAEPGDILVDDVADLAYVSCSASQAVVEIDLRARATSEVFGIDGPGPLHMTPDLAGNVLVGVKCSGNASGSHNVGKQLGELGILDLDEATSTVLDPAVVPNGLPDEDVFRIDRGAGGKLDAVARAMGAVCFELRIHPTTGDLWMLNTFARNKELAGEPAHRGVFARNELSIVTLPATSAGVVTPVRPHTTIDLDTVGLTGPPDPTRTVGQPMSFDFDSDGNAIIAGVLTDNFIMLDASGAFLGEWDLPDGSIPRQVLYNAALDVVFFYCWGTNELVTYWLGGANPTQWITYDLGEDPTPQLVKEGREVFYDAQHSLYNNLSCATCHVDGRSDHLNWDLGSERDPKGAFLTQTLAGIERLAPFHWRGERAGLADFNPAFTELLGAAEELDTTPGGELDQFEAFVFSIANPSNFVQNRERLIDDAVQPKLIASAPLGVAYATEGRALFNESCDSCHNYPVGTNSDFSRDGETRPKQRDRKVGPFHEFLRRDFDADTTQPGYQAVTAYWDPSNQDFEDASTDYPLTGSAMSARGLVPGIHGFARIFELTIHDSQQSADVASFLSQFDQGVAPATQRAFLLDEHASTQTLDDIEDYLVAQATTPYVTVSGQTVRNCGLAVLGEVTVAGSPVESAWYYDPDEPLASRFVPEDSSLPKVGLAYFLTQAAAGDASVVFVGTPNGMARRFAVDRDNDWLFNADEALHGTDPYVADTDGDGFPDGYEVEHSGDPLVADSGPLETDDPSIVPGSLEVLWETARVARLRFETDEPTTAVITYESDPTGQVATLEVGTYETLHSVILSGLLPSAFVNDSTYTVAVKVTDPSGNDNTAATTADGELLGGGPGGLVAGFFSPRGGVRLTDVEFTQVAVSIPGPGLTLNVRARVLQRKPETSDVPLAGYKVVGKVYRNGDSTVAFTSGSQQTFTYNSDPYDSTIGDSDPPFAISPESGADGYADFTISIPSAVPSDTIEFVVELVARPHESPFNFNDIGEWCLPATEPHERLAIYE